MNRLNNVLALLLVSSVSLALPFGQAGEGYPFPLEDAARLTNAGVGEEVLLAWVLSLAPYSAPTAEQIIALKKAKVPENVIASLIRQAGVKVSNPVPVAAKASANVQLDDRVTILSRYDVPSANKAVDYAQKGQVTYSDLPKTQTAVQRISQVQAAEPEKVQEARQEYTVRETVRYVYTEPVQTVYVQSAPVYYYGGYSAPIYYGGSYSYPSFSIGFSYGRYYGRNCGYYGRGYYGRHCGSYYRGGYGYCGIRGSYRGRCR